MNLLLHDTARQGVPLRLAENLKCGFQVGCAFRGGNLLFRQSKRTDEPGVVSYVHFVVGNLIVVVLSAVRSAGHGFQDKAHLAPGGRFRPVLLREQTETRVVEARVVVAV
ncbi:MAG: hypothetical protein ACPL3P_01635 [Anaerolineales bacterium]